MARHYADHVYLLMALGRGGTNVPCPAARSTLTRLGYMVPARLSRDWRGGLEAFGMALTKKGQQRAQEIAEQQLAKPRRKYGPSYKPKARKLPKTHLHW